MTQKLSAPTVEPRHLSIIAPVEKGGTNAVNPYDAAVSLGAVSRMSIGKDHGVAPYPLLIDLPNAAVSTATIDGPDTVSVNSVVLFTISNYDVKTTYAVSVSAGQVSTVDGVITYTAPATVQTIVMTVNGRSVSFDVTPVTPLAPIIASPVANATNIALSITITSSTLALPSGTPNHLSSDWQLATDAAFVNIVAGVFNDTVNKTTWSVPGLTIDTNYYVRVRHKDVTYGYSNWSVTSLFTTRHNILTGNEEAKLISTDGAANDLIGFSVAMSTDGTRVIVGSSGKSPILTTNEGAAYVFLRTGTTWAQEAKVVPTDPTNSSYFGLGVDLNDDGSRMIIGSYAKTGTATNQGAAYIFLRSGTAWNQEAKLIASDPAVSDYFGFAVGVNTDATRVVIGAYNKTGSLGASQGAVYVFLRTGTSWAQEQKIVPTDTAVSDTFGYAVSISSDGSRLAVGAPMKTGTAGSTQGAAYVYLRTGTVWAQEAKISAFDFAAGDNMGMSVSINNDGNRLGVGASSKKVSQTGQGVVYVFSRFVNNWTQENKLIATDAAASDAFGCSVSISNDGTRVAIGAYQKTGTAGVKEGACYIDS